MDAEFCRGQAMEHQVRAAASRLSNERDAALAAAAAWLKEAEYAERLEEQRASMLETKRVPIA